MSYPDEKTGAAASAAPDWAAKANVPYPLGSKVRPKRGPNRAYEWVVYDHHGVTWEYGTETNRVVLARTWDEPDDVPLSAPYDPNPDVPPMLTTTWGRIEPA